MLDASFKLTVMMYIAAGFVVSYIRIIMNNMAEEYL